MKLLSSLTGILIACLGLNSQAFAQGAPAPTYVKKAVFVRIHWDSSFYNHWRFNRGSKGNLSDAQINAMLQQYFDEVRADYLNHPLLHSIDLILLNDFERPTGPMADYVDGSPQVGGDVRLINAMHERLQTGAVTKTASNGVTHALGRTINWVFVWGQYGGQQGKSDSIRGIATTDANLFVTTSAGDTQLTEIVHEAVLETLEHETGHLVGGEHGADSSNPLADCANFAHREIMCSGAAGGIGRERRFGSANFTRVAVQMKGALQRCNSAFASANSCNNFVSNTLCGTFSPAARVQQDCIEPNQQSLCQDICTSAQKAARVLIKSLPPTITSLNGSVVTAAGPKQ